MAPSALDGSVPDTEIPIRMAVPPIGTPRKSGSLNVSSINGNSTSGLGFGPIGSRSNSNGNSHRASTPASTESDIDNFWRRYHMLKLNDSRRYTLLEDVITRYEDLQQRHNEYVKATEQELLARPSEKDLMYRDYAQKLHSILVREAFMLVLIDGDGMVFHENLLRLGEHGGKQAADILAHTVDGWARANLRECPLQFKIIVRVYANVKGLAETCRRAGIISDPDTIEDFVRGFTNQNSLFDFTDVGPGKDRANVKMKAEFEMFIYNFQCRHILFGCSHESGFAHFLGKYASDAESVSRVTLMEGVSFEKELDQLPFSKYKFNGLFRERKIVVNPPGLLTEFPRGRQDSHNSFNPASGIFTPASRMPAPEAPASCPQSGFGPATPIISTRGDLTRTNSAVSSSPISESPIPTNGGVGGSGWASIARGSAHLPFKDISRATSEVKVTGPVIRRNKAGQRIDPPMDYDHDKVFELKKMKYCNQHYIGRGCCHFSAGNGACPHKHDAKLSKEDLKWLRVVARETVCKKGNACADFECIYGE